MSDFLALGEIIAVWIALSIALWGIRRLWIRSRQRSHLDSASRAVELTHKAQPVFDTIRVPVPQENAPEAPEAYLRAETYALLERIQEQGSYFDHINTLLVQIQAALGIENHKGLSDILHLRRDLWAASEIVLVEDPAQFGSTFADDGAFERFHAEAVRTLYKLPGQADGNEDIIDLRLTLAIQEAEKFASELAEAFAAQRERERLPTSGELAAYPLAWIRAIPVILRGCVTFMRAFFEQASLLSQRIRGSETVTRSAARMRQIGEDWPQRLSDSFLRASEAARENASTLRQHYDFLAAAHDFKGKYQKLIQSAPELSERSKQFIARLELAERSERLRLTSANAAIWTARKAVDGFAHVIAFLRRFYAAMQETILWSAAAAALAPAPVRGRRIPVFKSYHHALAVSGLIEPRQALNWRHDQDAIKPAKPAKQTAAKPVREEQPLKSHRRNMRRSAPPATEEQPHVASGLEKRAAPASTAKRASRKAAAKSSIQTGKLAVKEARAVKHRKKQAPPMIFNAPAPSPPSVSVVDEGPVGASVSPPAQTLIGAELKSKPVVQPSVPDVVADGPPNQAVIEVMPEPVLEINTVRHADDLPPIRKEAAERGSKTSRSFLSRLFKRDNGSETDASKNENLQQDEAFHSDLAGGSDILPISDDGAYEPSPSLMDKLSSLGPDNDAGKEEAPEDVEKTRPADTDEQIANDSIAENTDDFGPLTQSIMELQVKTKPVAPQIRAFPWLRQ